MNVRGFFQPPAPASGSRRSCARSVVTGIPFQPESHGPEVLRMRQTRAVETETTRRNRRKPFLSGIHPVATSFAIGKQDGSLLLFVTPRSLQANLSLHRPLQASSLFKSIDRQREPIARARVILAVQVQLPAASSLPKNFPQQALIVYTNSTLFL